MEITGGCLCRAVRFRITAQPIAMRLCWCRVCQYLASGNATVNVVFPSDAISIEGELRDYRSVADSGSVMHRRFCPTCGTHLFSASESRPHLIIVRNGALDDTALASPRATIWTTQAPEWAWIDESFPHHAGNRRPLPELLIPARGRSNLPRTQGFARWVSDLTDLQGFRLARLWPWIEKTPTRRFAFAAILAASAVLLHWPIFPLTKGRTSFIFFPSRDHPGHHVGRALAGHAGRLDRRPQLGTAKRHRIAARVPIPPSRWR